MQEEHGDEGLLRVVDDLAGCGVRQAVRVTDDGAPVLSDVVSFSITVDESNQPPNVEAIEDQMVEVSEAMSLTVVATDPDDPPNGLSFSLEPGAPAGATIDPWL